VHVGVVRSPDDRFIEAAIIGPDDDVWHLKQGVGGGPDGWGPWTSSGGDVLQLAFSLKGPAVSVFGLDAKTGNVQYSLLNDKDNWADLGASSAAGFKSICAAVEQDGRQHVFGIDTESGQMSHRYRYLASHGLQERL
jgi:hypothetical protein